VAVRTTRATNALSRRLHLGSGTVAGGRLGLAVDPSLLRSLSAGRLAAVVTGTNGKTTTTRLLATAIAARGAEVVTNSTGANMPPGHVAAMASGADGAPAVLEVDEAYLPQALLEIRPVVVVLLNLSRDQLDRTNEVRMLAAKWRRALASQDGFAVRPRVVANSDDPLVAFGALAATDVTWVAAGSRWRNDAVGCPACGGRIVFGSESDPEDPAWRCSVCDLRRPVPDVRIVWGRCPTDEPAAVTAGGLVVPITLALPGRFNAANAVMAAAAAERFGCALDQSLDAMTAVEEVAGRFTRRRIGGVDTRLLLAKNPAGWAELLELVRQRNDPVVVAINARVADGRDPSWLWDVPFGELAGRTVVASGERFRDVAVRLRYAEVAHEAIADPFAAIAAAGRHSGVTFIGNYTAFHDVLRRLPEATRADSAAEGSAGDASNP
jgi:UDP-N-acetylmuramyl tripeptide synthase